MGSHAEFHIPAIEFPLSGSPELERGMEGWQNLCKRVKEACENYGCFEVVYESIAMKHREETFSSIRELLLEVPLERKQKNVNPKPYHSYFGPCSQTSLYEGFGIEDASNYDSVKSFAQLMWPHGRNNFCESVNSMVKQLEELSRIIWSMIIDSYEVEEKSEWLMKEYYMLLRMMRYMAPVTGEYRSGLLAHTDKLATTIVCQDQISGLEVEIKEGEWIKVFPSPCSFIFFVGDPLMAWSNGRMKARKHRVMMSGDKDRYSFAVFAVPAEGTIIKTPKGLVDDQHPQLFKQFEFMDFLHFSNSEEANQIDSAHQLYAFASLPQHNT